MAIMLVCFVPSKPLLILYIPWKQIMYFILTYLTEHITPEEWSFGVNSEGSDTVIDKKLVHRTEEGEKSEGENLP